MRENRYGTFLTVILVVAIIGAIALFGFWIYQKYKEYDLITSAEDAIEQFDAQFQTSVKENNQSNQDEATVDYSNIKNPYDDIIDVSDGTTGSSKTTKTTNSGSISSTNAARIAQKKLYKGFVMTGYIQIPRTRVKLPVLESVSTKALNVAVGILIGPGLNKPGNTVIVGHNYRNGTLFSRNGQLEIGDLIYITDEYGDRVQYTIYNIYLTTPEDSDYMTRDTDGKPEISLSTCTDDNTQRIIIWARIE